MSFISLQNQQFARSIGHTFTAQSEGRVVILADNRPNWIKQRLGITNQKCCVNAFIHELYCYSGVRSLPEVPIPNYQSADPDIVLTDSDRLQLTLRFEWGTARFELAFYLGDPNNRWHLLGSTAIKNVMGHRYRRHRAQDLLTDNPVLQLQENWRLGAQLHNVGYGYLKAQDTLSIVGGWTQELVLSQSMPPSVVNNVYGGTGTGGTTPPPPEEPTTASASLPPGESTGFMIA